MGDVQMSVEKCAEYEVFKHHVDESNPYRKQTDINAANIANLEKAIVENRQNIGLLYKKIDSLIWKVVGANIAIYSAAQVITRLIN